MCIASDLANWMVYVCNSSWHQCGLFDWWNISVTARAYIREHWLSSNCILLLIGGVGASCKIYKMIGS